MDMLMATYHNCIVRNLLIPILIQLLRQETMMANLSQKELLEREEQRKETNVQENWNYFKGKQLW